MNLSESVSIHFSEHQAVISSLLEMQSEMIEEVAAILRHSLSNDGTIFCCGNGGSAADSQHLAAELVGLFENERKSLRCLALTTDTSVLTCIANDYSYEDIFSRQIEALGRSCDVLVVFSTSGNSDNILRALSTAKKIGLTSVALLGKDGGQAKLLADHALIVKSDSTARIQEAHILICHIICDLIEKGLDLD